MFDIILTYSGYISDYLWSCLTGDEDAKSINRSFYIVITGIKSIYTRDICINNTCTLNTWMRCANIEKACTKNICTINIFIRDVEPRILIELVITLIFLRRNNYCLQLFIRLIFALIEEMSCWNK